MAQKGKNYYVTVSDDKHKTVLHKMFFNVKEANAFVEEMKKKYPPTYKVVRELY